MKHITTHKTNSYDAIVIGSGISGGWAAKELCEKGLKTLVLERGRMVKHIDDYPTMFKEDWDFKHRGRLSSKDKKNTTNNQDGDTLVKQINIFIMMIR